MYNLITSAGGKVLRSGAPASRTLKDWFQAETTGYEVTCHDESGAAVTKAQLRTVTRPAEI